ncbi:MAG: tetratricopeptide repeat protein [Planctomycetaceae bacterium]|nr:tetratricopeptide repeat protein [Planctomycetaceae bacterium]
MVALPPDFDLRQTILMDGPFGPQETERLTHALSADVTQIELLRTAIGELENENTSGKLSPAGYVRLGVANYLLGHYETAIASLKKGDGGALALFHIAKARFAQGLYQDALTSYDAAQKAGYNADACTLGRAEVYCYQAQPEEALKHLDKLQGAIEQTAEYLYQRGAALSQMLYDEDGNLLTGQAIKFYERAVAIDKNHPGALFGLALESERRGNDEEALDMYKRAISRFPTHSGALFNLGVLYEDMGMYDQAIVCFQRIADSQPANQKAKLFFKDAKASSEMHIDEETQRRRDRMSQILNQPVSDFELSVRSRNCLKTMGIMTLADLCSHTEQELLTSKNFGETSLVEIREMLALKGLKLGIFAQEKQTPEVFDVSTLSPEVQAVLENSVIDLNLSVRARKCMSRLNIQTIGELIRKSADELLDCKNFGVTSLNEIREKLATPPFDLKLRGE